MGLLKFLNKRAREVYGRESRRYISTTGGYVRRRQSMVHVSQLSIGMYVSGLDRPWLDTPFCTQGFYVRSQEDIDQIKRYCERVYIDIIHKKAVSLADPTREKEIDVSIHKLPDKSAWNGEEKSYLRSQELTRSILDEVRLRGIIREESVRDTVRTCLDSILQNSHTLLWVSQLAKQGNSTLERHALSVCILAIAFGRYLGLSKEELEKLGSSAILHDVGMLALDEDVRERIYSGQAELSDTDRTAVNAHTELGRDLLVSNDWLMSAIDVAYCHHEHFDGTGYPRGLRGGAIPELAQIVALADTYDAITNAQSYQSNKSSLDALKIIYDQRDQQFDPNLALSFIRFITIYPPGAIVELKNELIGIVIDATSGHKHLPTIMLLLNADRSARKPELISLAEKYKMPEGQNYSIVKMYPPGSFDIDTRLYLDPS
ncbi:MAG: HD-GYP domain-containing protein [Pseudomonadales bacterium]